MPLLRREEAIQRFPTLDPKAAKSVPNVRESPEVLEARRKLEELEAHLATIKREIAEAERRPMETRTAADLDAERILQGKPLDAQPPAGDLEELRRRRTAVERAVEMQNRAVAEIILNVGRQACDRLDPLARKYATQIVEALDALHDALETLNCFSGFLASRGIKGTLRPQFWEPTPIELQIVNLVEMATASRRKAFDLPAKK